MEGGIKLRDLKADKVLIDQCFCKDDRGLYLRTKSDYVPILAIADEAIQRAIKAEAELQELKEKVNRVLLLFDSRSFDAEDSLELLRD